MGKNEINSATEGDMTNVVEDYSVDPVTLDSPQEQEITWWGNADFGKWMGYYKSIPELRRAIDAKSLWTVGKGFKADSATKKRLSKVVGQGKDSFNSIMKNAVKVYNIGGDFFAEIITSDGEPINEKGTNLLNLKPLNPANIEIGVNEAGMIVKYRQKTSKQEWEPEEMFHLARDRVADEFHGQSIIEAIENIVLMRNEAMEDLKVVFHRYVKPLWIWLLDSDDTTKIAAFQAKADEAVNSGENLYIPKGAAEAERVSVPQYSTLDPLPWIESLTQYFYQATGMPDVILGTAKQTVEASAKILYLAFQQSIEDNQLFLEENIEAQLHQEVNFEFPASIEADMTGDEKKDANKQTKINPKETKAGIGGKK